MRLCEIRFTRLLADDQFAQDSASVLRSLVEVYIVTGPVMNAKQGYRMTALAKLERLPEDEHSPHPTYGGP